MYMPYVRYKFESNSQHFDEQLLATGRCICHMLDTSLKAIHNESLLRVVRGVMYMPYVRYKSESNKSKINLFSFCENPMQKYE